MQESWIEIPSPFRKLLLFANDEALTWIDINGERTRPEGNPRPNTILREAAKQLAEYFAGRRTAFDLPLALNGTDFQNKVWKAMQKIPYGETRTYGWLAHLLKTPKASRAVGAACGRNPLPIIIPCHRVVGSNGSLTGFGGGLPMKEWLLQHEGLELEV